MSEPMAPESERANVACGVCRGRREVLHQPMNKWLACPKCDPTRYQHDHLCVYGWNDMTDNRKNPPPPLTCSEVVERLAECTYLLIEATGFPRAKLNLAEAEKILNEWRERRVQELEEALREMVTKHGVHSGECFSCDFFVREVGRHSGACPIPKAESLLAKSDEWREQIRKGAKHESDL